MSQQYTSKVMITIPNTLKENISDLLAVHATENEPNNIIVDKVVMELIEQNLIEQSFVDLLNDNDDDEVNNNIIDIVEAYVEKQLLALNQDEDDKELASIEAQDVALRLVKSLEVIEDDLEDEQDWDDDEGDEEFRDAEEDEWRNDFRGRGFSKFQLEDEENFDLDLDDEHEF